jgi:hypothetical protein
MSSRRAASVEKKKGTCRKSVGFDIEKVTGAFLCF